MIENVIVGLIAGAVFGLYGYFTKHEDGENFDYVKIGRTVVVYGIAGAIVGSRGEPLTEDKVMEATAYTVVLGEIFDKLVSRIQKNMD